MTAPGAACETSAPTRRSAMSVRYKKAGRGRRASRRSWPAATRADAGRRTRSQKDMTKATEPESLVRLARRAPWRASAPLTEDLESHCRASSIAGAVRSSPTSPLLPSTVSAMASSYCRATRLRAAHPPVPWTDFARFRATRLPKLRTRVRFPPPAHFERRRSVRSEASDPSGVPWPLGFPAGYGTSRWGPCSRDLSVLRSPSACGW